MIVQKTCLVLLLAVLLGSRVLGQSVTPESESLPRFETETERLLRPSYIPPAGVSVLPPSQPVRAMAEYERLEGVVVRWGYGTFDLLLSQIVDAAQEEGKVWILARPGTSDSINVKSYLAGRGIPLTNIEFLSINTNSIWSRDYGPWSVYTLNGDSLGIVDFRYNRPRPLDDVVPEALAARWNLPLYQTVHQPDSLVHTGGNFMVDGFGTGFSSRLVVDENPHLTVPAIDTIMARYCGLTRFVKMTNLQYDIIHHIDMHMKLLDEETILIGQYPVNVSDYAIIEATVDSLRTLTNCYGRPYRIVRIPMPPDLSGQYPPNSNYLTYTNSVIIITTVLVPIYGLPTDSVALNIYRNAMPGYTVMGFDCNAIIPLAGAIHCIVKEVGVREPVLVAHARLGSTGDTVNAYRVAATIRTRSGVDSAFVVWSREGMAGPAVVPMVDSSGTFVAYIPPQSAGTSVTYHLSVRTNSGLVVSEPLTGIRGGYRFEVEDTSATAVPAAAGPPTFELFQNYPNPFNPVTVFKFQVPRQTDGGQAGSRLVTLKVYDVLGREVATLVDGPLPAGSHWVEWKSAGFASGVYFYALTSVDRAGRISQQIRKGVLLK